MIDANVLRAVGDVLETHGVKPKRGESIADAVARALGLSNAEVHRWVEALSEGSSVEEANRRTGIASKREGDPLLVTVAVPSVKLSEKSSASAEGRRVMCGMQSHGTGLPPATFLASSASLNLMAVTSPKILEAGGTEVSTAAGGARRYRKPLTAFRWCDIKALLSESVGEWNRHKGPRLGAALAFYTLLSLTPLLLIAVGIAGLVFGREAAQSQIVWQIQDLVGPSGAQAIKALLEGARNTTHGILATVLGLLTLLFGASGVLIELRDALNTIWEVPPAQRSGLQNLVDLIKERMFSFALVLAIGFLLLVSLAINACISALGAFSAHAFPLSEGILHIANTLLSFIVTSALFAAIYRIMPDVRIEWRDVALGAAVTSLLFTVGKLLIGLYLGHASFASTYGAAASIVLLIVWVYYSGQVFFLGAEFTKVFADRYGSQPTRHPEAMVIEKTNPRPTSAEELKIIAPSDLQNRGSEPK